MKEASDGDAGDGEEDDDQGEEEGEGEAYFDIPASLGAKRHAALAEEVLDISRLLVAPFGAARPYEAAAAAQAAAAAAQAECDGEESGEVGEAFFLDASEASEVAGDLEEPWARVVDAVAEVGGAKCIPQ